MSLRLTLFSLLGKKGILRFHVVDWSMAPRFVPGEVVFAETQEDVGRAVRENDIVVLHDPEVPGRKLIKRVQEVTRDGPDIRLFVVGDNLPSSRDSRHFGTVKANAVVGIVLEDV